MKAPIMKDVVELEKVQSMTNQISEYFYRRGELEGLGGTEDPTAWYVFNDAKAEVTEIINRYMKDMTNEY